jgi:hypothetical protein
MSGSPRSPSTLLLVGRVALLAAAAAAVVIAFVATRADKGAASRRSGAVVRYTCAMHPEVLLPGPGECPICRMTLERVRTAAMPGDPRSTDTAPFRPSYDVMWARPRPAPREMRAPAYVGGDGAVVALFYNDEIAALEANERGTFSESGAPGSSWPVRVADTSSTPWDEATSAVRLAVIGSSGAPAAGRIGWVKLAPRVHQTLMVPESALLQSSTGPYVLALASDRRAAAKRSVDIGRTLYGFTSIVGGLRDGERIAVMDAFFLDAERRLGGAASGAEPTTPAAAP